MIFLFNGRLRGKALFDRILILAIVRFFYLSTMTLVVTELHFVIFLHPLADAINRVKYLKDILDNIHFTFFHSDCCCFFYVFFLCLAISELHFCLYEHFLISTHVIATTIIHIPNILKLLLRVQAEVKYLILNFFFYEVYDKCIF
ncbi:hypothetical protein Pfo_007990 [Paulownia fortunei]|nr:hypothetical protein Pfo_007990 [Paulownia fortunei]